jgi:hypothetical protein
MLQPLAHDQLEQPSAIMATVFHASQLPCDEVEGVEIGLRSYLTLETGTELLRPHFSDGRSIIVDLEDPGEFVQIVKGFPYNRLDEHHSDSVTRSLKLLFAIPETTMMKLMSYDRAIMRDAMVNPVYIREHKGLFPPVKDRHDNFRAPNMNTICNWLPLDKGNQLVVSVVLEESDAPTQLVFATETGIVQGTGQDFWNLQVGTTPLHDFICQVRVEFQFVQVDMQKKTIQMILKVNCLKMARKPKATIVKCNEDELEAFSRAVKRIRVDRL